MNIFLEVHRGKEKAIQLEQYITDFIMGNSFFNKSKNSIVDTVEKSDIIVTLGGDGTILRAWNKYHSLNKPFWGINCGTLGYMTEGDEYNWRDKLNLIFDGKYTIEKCMTLAGSIYRDNQNNGDRELVYSGVAMNDIVLYKANGGVVHFNVEVDGQHLTYMNADGIICSSPIGCTGYAISCGGGFIDPRVDIFQLIGIAPHTLLNRSILISKNSTIDFRVTDTTNGVVQFDGMDAGVVLDKEFVLSIKKSDEYLQMVSVDDGVNFIDKIARTFTLNK